MSRLGLAGRLILLIAVVLLFVQVLGVAAYLSDRQEAVPDRPLLPFPDQLDALVDLFDSAPAAERDLLLRALSDSEVILDLQPALPHSEAPPPGAAQGDLILPGLQQRLQDYTTALGAHQIEVAVPAEQATGGLPRLRAYLAPERVRIAVRLTDGQWLVVQRQHVVGLAIGGLPVGLVSALLATLVALAAIGGVWWETRPLRHLAQAARRFGRDLTPAPLPLPRAPDLRALVGAFNDMQDQIATADRNRTDMMAALAHDMRTPLARLVLRLRKLEPDLRTAAERDIDDIAHVADSAFRFAAADLAVLDGTVDLRDLARRLADQTGLALRDDQPDQPLQLQGNAELIGRALWNLADNARKYAGGGRILLVPGRDLHSIVIEDDGPGIPPQDRARLLEPFQRGEPSRNGATGGTGLGLALARRIALRHNGTLTLGDAPGGGLRVTLDLPARR